MDSSTIGESSGVGFFGMLIIGIVAGYIAERVMQRDHGLLTNLLVGIAGSFVAGTLASFVGIAYHGWIGNLIIASIGAVAILWFFGKSRAIADQRRSDSVDSSSNNGNGNNPK